MRARILLNEQDYKAVERVAEIFKAIVTTSDTVETVDIETPRHKVIENVYFDNCTRIDKIQDFFEGILEMC